MKAFKNNLKHYRQQSGMTFGELGLRVGLSKSHLHGLEQPDANPTLQTAYVISAILGVAVADIWPSQVEVEEERKTFVVRRVRGLEKS